MSLSSTQDALITILVGFQRQFMAQNLNTYRTDFPLAVRFARVGSLQVTVIKHCHFVEIRRCILSVATLFLWYSICIEVHIVPSLEFYVKL